ncbi:MAG: hypothetical protein N2445_06685 [Acidobacteria bacterium]|nr:hypothetical protein [Acidobacteriota bacterium]
MLGLDPKEDGSSLRRLPVGHGFVLMRNSEFPYPFTVAFRKFPLLKGSISEEDVKNHMKNRIIVQPLPENIIENLPEIEGHEKSILRAIGLGKGVFASQIYKSLRLSGSTFRENIESLMHKGIVDMKTVKMKRTKAHYYFLTDLGERIFSEKFSIPQKNDDINLEAIKEGFEKAGYIVEIKEGFIILGKEGEEKKVAVITSTERKKIFEIVKTEENFLCSTHSIACIVVQQAARYVKNTGKSKTINIATQDLRLGFEKIEL